MSNLRRAAVLKLANAAYEMGLGVRSGKLTRDEAGRWLVGETPLESLLAAHDGEEVVFVLGSLVDNRPVAPRTCRTCGRDYTDVECPHCRANRIRFRGQP